MTTLSKRWRRLLKRLIFIIDVLCLIAYCTPILILVMFLAPLAIFKPVMKFIDVQCQLVIELCNAFEERMKDELD